ncbi:MAG: flagellar biosynthetic protein FliR [Gemmatimonadales bacterium]|nr:flagellar biosynthetic protein FliR [Gemmatimonadales bacterium]
MSAASLADLLSPGHWPTWTLVSARVTGMVAVGPLWSISAAPGAVKGAVVVVLSTLLAGAIPPAVLPPDYPGLAVVMGGELLLGLALGLAAALVLDGLALAGEVMGVQMGLNLGPALGVTIPGETVGVGQLQSRAALTVFVALGGHLTLLAALHGSLRELPPGTALDLPAGSRHVVQLARVVFEVGVRAAAPVMVTMLLLNVALAVLNRAVPQLNAMIFSFPFTIATGFLVVGATAPFLVGLAGSWAGGLEGRLAGVVAAFAGGR